MTKKCSTCREDKALSAFQADTRVASGRRARCKKCVSEYQHAKYVADLPPEKRDKAKRISLVRDGARGSRLRRQYGLSGLQEFNERLLAQGGRCANPGCRSPEAGAHGTFHVDHDHVTGKVRGLLCNNCNIAAGLLRDDLPRIRGLADYLESFAIALKQAEVMKQ